MEVEWKEDGLEGRTEQDARGARRRNKDKVMQLENSCQSPSAERALQTLALFFRDLGQAADLRRPSLPSL